MESAFIKTAIDSGLSIGIFALCCWLVITIVKTLCATMDKLVSKMDRFCERVREEHTSSAKQHEKIMEQHEGIIETLGRINGYKGNN